MAGTDYSFYFREEQQSKIGIKLADNKFLDISGVVRFIERDRLTLELMGSEPVENLNMAPGADVLVSVWSGWSLCRCNAVLIQKISGRRVYLRLMGPVIEKQTREYFRLDVSIPVTYTISENQLLPDALEEWAATRGQIQKLAAPVLMKSNDGFRLVRWNDQTDIKPALVNLSGGGLRLKTPEFIKPESLVTINLFLPLIPPRVIHTVAESLRCKEIMLGRGKGDSNITAMRFHFINEKDRETIIAFIFSEQRRQLRTSCL